MTNILIAAENMRYRRALTDVLSAAGHHVATTSDPVLALAALRVSEKRFVALLSDIIALHDVEGLGLLDILASDETGSASLARQREHIQHAYILLTKLPPDELPEGLRALRTYGRTAILDPNCSIGTLLAAVELAAEQLALDEAVESAREKSAPPLRATTQ